MRFLSPPEGSKKLFCTMVILSFLMATLEALGVGSIGPLIAITQSPSKVMDGRIGELINTIFPRSSENEIIMYLGSSLAAIFILKIITSIFHAYTQHRYSQIFYSKISSKLLNGYLNMPFHFHVKKNSAILTRNVTTETRLIVDNIVIQSITVASEILVCLLVVSVLFYLDHKVAFIVGLISVTLLGSMLFATRAIGSKLGVLRDEQQQEMIKTAQSVLSGLKEIIISGKKNFFLDRFENLSEKYAKSVTIIGFIQIIPRMALESIALISIIVSFLYTKSQGTVGQDLPLIITYIVAGYRLLPSFNRIFVSGLMIYYILPTLKESFPSLIEALDAKEEKIHTINEEIMSINLLDICFRYDKSSDYIIKNIDLSLKKGEIVGLTGSSGAGKSTLIGIILGLLPPSCGAISWNQKTLRTKEDRRGLQTKVAYVAQQVFIADDTILANIALGESSDKIDKNRITKSIQIAHLEDVIKTLPDGLNTQIGERAARLSGGQAQRIGIARAIYANRPILILDEATSSLDTQTEKKVLDALREDKSNRITIVIAHRTTALADCDLIYPLSYGHIGPSMSFSDYTEKTPSY